MSHARTTRCDSTQDMAISRRMNRTGCHNDVKRGQQQATYKPKVVERIPLALN